jgi:ribonuclease HI
VKVNWDVAVDNVRGKVGIGVIIRDHERDIIAMLCANKRYVTDPLLAEALAVWQASDLVKQLDLRRVTLEGDALSIVQAMEKKGDCRSEFGQVLNDAKETMNRCLSWDVQHVKRSANEGAHQLAKLALTIEDDRLWRKDFPSCIMGYVCA